MYIYPLGPPPPTQGSSKNVFWENATVHGRAWYKLLDALVLTLDVTVCGSRRKSKPGSQNRPGGLRIPPDPPPPTQVDTYPKFPRILLVYYSQD